MPSETWNFQNNILSIQINKISNLFSQDLIQTEGDNNKGKVVFKSIKLVDEVWQHEARMEISFEKMDPTQYHHGLKVKETIRMFSAIEVNPERKETHWHLSHEMTYWYGNRQQILRKRYYPSRIIHGVVFCELSHRLFEFHAIVLAASFQKYEKAFLDTLMSLQCHG